METFLSAGCFIGMVMVPCLLTLLPYRSED
jgi:hypothetical protein